MRSNVDIGIFSTGDKEFQLQKIATLKDLFPENHTHIFVDKREGLADVFSQYKGTHLYLVDDFPAILYEAKKMDKTISTVWIKRDDQGSPQVLLEDFPQIADFIPDYTIKQLDEILTCIKE